MKVEVFIKMRTCVQVSSRYDEFKNVSKKVRVRSTRHDSVNKDNSSRLFNLYETIYNQEKIEIGKAIATLDYGIRNDLRTKNQKYINLSKLSD